jgi:hypothetical protein
MVAMFALPLICLPASSPRERGEAGLRKGFRQSAALQIERQRRGRLLLPVYGEKVPEGRMRGGTTRCRLGGVNA